VPYIVYCYFITVMRLWCIFHSAGNTASS